MSKPAGPAENFDWSCWNCNMPNQTSGFCMTCLRLNKVARPNVRHRNWNKRFWYSLVSGHSVKTNVFYRTNVQESLREFRKSLEFVAGEFSWGCFESADFICHAELNVVKTQTPSVRQGSSTWSLIEVMQKQAWEKTWQIASKFVLLLPGNLFHRHVPTTVSSL